MATLGRRRAFGQHFLRDRKIAETIARTALEEASRAGCVSLLEIGPGKGAITEPIMANLSLAPSVRELILCERDARLAQYWREHANPGVRPDERPEVRVECADFNELPEALWLGATPLAVASNLPYSAGTAILTRLAGFPDRIPVMVLMFQAEVARRLRAEPKTKEWGSLSVWIQNRWEVQKLLFVPPGAFSPPPEVDSEVLILRPRSKPRVPSTDLPGGADRWQALLKACFAHRRKMLRSGLPKASPWQIALEVSQVDGTKRAEALSWEEWDQLLAAALQ